MTQLISKIETIGMLPDKRVIRQTCSYPEGVSYEFFLRKDLANRRAFGAHNSATLGTWKDTGETRRIGHGDQRKPITRNGSNQGHAGL